MKKISKKLITALSFLSLSTMIPMVASCSISKNSNPPPSSQSIDPQTNDKSTLSTSLTSSSLYKKVTFSPGPTDAVIVGDKVQQLKKGKPFSSLTPPTATELGKVFKYWYYVDEAGAQIRVNPSTTFTKDIELFPFLESQSTEHTITFNPGSGSSVSFPTATVFSSTIFEEIAKPVASKSNATFVGWYFEDKKISDNMTFTEDIELTAKYTSDFPDKSFNTITFLPGSAVAYGNTVVAVEPNSTILSINKPLVTSSTGSFSYWSVNDTKISSTYILKEGDILTPVFDSGIYGSTDKFFSFFPETNQYGYIESGIYDSSSDITYVLQDGTKKTYKRSEFNYPLSVGSKITSIENNFLQNCSSFNSIITIPNSVQSIGEGFLKNCVKYNSKISLPGSLTKVPNNFLSGCTTFNSSVQLSNGIKEIGDNFLSGCTGFNSDIVFPNTLTTIGNYFLSGCSALNTSINLSSCSSLKTVGDYFLQNCSQLNKVVYLSPSITTIKTYFMSGCSSYSTTLTLPSSIKTIGDHFLYNCTKFSYSVTVPNSITTSSAIGGYFMYGCNNITRIYIQCPVSCFTSSSYTLATNSSSATCYTTGITISGTYADDFYDSFPSSSSSSYYRKLKEDNKVTVTFKNSNTSLGYMYVNGSSCSSYTIKHVPVGSSRSSLMSKYNISVSIRSSNIDYISWSSSTVASTDTTFSISYTYKQYYVSSSKTGCNSGIYSGYYNYGSGVSGTYYANGKGGPTWSAKCVIGSWDCTDSLWNNGYASYNSSNNTVYIYIPWSYITGDTYVSLSVYYQ